MYETLGRSVRRIPHGWKSMSCVNVIDTERRTLAMADQLSNLYFANLFFHVLSGNDHLFPSCRLHVLPLLLFTTVRPRVITFGIKPLPWRNSTEGLRTESRCLDTSGVGNIEFHRI